MAGSGFGTNFRITTWGETHGAGVGVVVDGCPAGLPLEEEQQGLRSPWLYITRIRGLKITAISKIFTVQDMQILHLI